MTNKYEQLYSVIGEIKSIEFIYIRTFRFNLKVYLKQPNFIEDEDAEKDKGHIYPLELTCVHSFETNIKDILELVEKNFYSDNEEFNDFIKFKTKEIIENFEKQAMDFYPYLLDIRKSLLINCE